jgi:predicted ABC-type transport system involved in lysophospholipase L1 biosynthesis ATPase subunit
VNDQQPPLRAPAPPAQSERGEVGRGAQPPAEVVLQVRNLVKHFELGGGLLGGPRRRLRAVDGVSFTVRRGETLGLVGESGCGKTTLARCVLQLERPTSGAVIFEGRDLTRLSEAELRPLRRRIQVCFQDLYGSLNPRMTVGQTLAEPLAVHRLVPDRARLTARVHELLGRVGLAALHADRYPHELEPRKSKGPVAPAEAAKFSRCRAAASQEGAPRRPEGRGPGRVKDCRWCSESAGRSRTFLSGPHKPVRDRHGGRRRRRARTPGGARGRPVRVEVFHERSSCGRGGALDGRAAGGGRSTPTRWSRGRRVSGRVGTATIRRRPPQRGPRRTSHANTRVSTAAHERRTGSGGRGGEPGSGRTGAPATKTPGS